MAKQSGHEYESLLAIAKQAVASSCSIKPEDVRVDEDGEICVDASDGSAAVFLSVNIDPNYFLFQTILLDGIEERTIVYMAINTVNQDLPLGQLYFEDGCIHFYYRLIVGSPSVDLLKWTLAEIVNKLDYYDDILKLQLGGERYRERDGADSIDMSSISLFDLVLLGQYDASNKYNQFMLEFVSEFVEEEDVAAYSKADEEDKAFLLRCLHLVMHSSIDEFKEFFRGYYGTPDNNFHAENLEEGILTISQEEFFDQLNWNQIYDLCRRHCDADIIAKWFAATTGADYAAERLKYPVDPWDGKPAWPMADGQYLASE